MTFFHLELKGRTPDQQRADRGHRLPLIKRIKIHSFYFQIQHIIETQ